MSEPSTTVQFSDSRLVLQSSDFTRIIDFSTGLPITASLKYKNQELAESTPDTPDCQIAGLGYSMTPEDLEMRKVSVRDWKTYAGSELDGPGVTVAEVTTFEEYRQIECVYRYLLYEGLPLIASEFEFNSQVVPILFWYPRYSDSFNQVRNIVHRHTIVDSLKAAAPLENLHSIEFNLQTDYRNHTVLHHDRCENDGEWTGNILQANIKNQPLFWYSEAPGSKERRDLQKFDFLIRDNRISNLISGVFPGDVSPEHRLLTYRQILGAGDLHALKAYQLARLSPRRRNSQAITVNPWGSGSLYENMNNDFIKAEIRNAGRLNADFYQIDDGYQKGGYLCDITCRNLCIDKSFWEINPELFPNGFDELPAAAKEAGVNLSLWFAPTTNREFKDWRDSAEILLNFYRRYGIKTFKLDGIIFSSYLAEERFRKLLHRLWEGSDGEITVNLDVTNGIRGGFSLFNEYGNIFLENRYVYFPSQIICYHPELSLRNLWNIGSCICTQNIQLEIPSYEDVDPDAYDKPGYLDSPKNYPVEFWCGTALFANPLLWFAPSRQSDTLIQKIAPLMKLYRQYRKEIFSGVISPIGTEPGQGRLTGFLSDAGYAIVYRERKTDPTSRILPPHQSSDILYYSGTQKPTILDDGYVTLPEEATFVLLRFK